MPAGHIKISDVNFEEPSVTGDRHMIQFPTKVTRIAKQMSFTSRSIAVSSAIFAWYSVVGRPRQTSVPAAMGAVRTGDANSIDT